MSNFDYRDIIVRRVTNKGTKIVKEPLKNGDWTGEQFKKKELERLKLAGDLMIMSAKGTKKIRLSEMRQTQTPDPKGHYIVTGKGTSRQRLE